MGNGPEKEKSLGTMAEKPYTMCTFFGVPAGKYINTERTPDCVAVMSQRRAGNLPFRPPADPHSSLSVCVSLHGGRGEQPAAGPVPGRGPLSERAGPNLKRHWHAGPGT